MMTRRKGEDPQQPQESSAAQPTRSSKEKGNVAVPASTAATAAAKLEKYAHTPSHSPAKSNQLPHEKTQTGLAGDRKSVGRMSAASVALPASTKTTNKKSPELVSLEKGMALTNGASSDLSTVGEPEPTLKEVLAAVNACKGSLNDLCNQLRGLKEELRSMGQELQKVLERTTLIEERLSQVEDTVYPTKI